MGYSHLGLPMPNRRMSVARVGVEPTNREGREPPRLAVVAVMQVQVLLPEPLELMRGRLTVGQDTLNVLMLVRFQPPQLRNGSHPAG